MQEGAMTGLDPRAVTCGCRELPTIPGKKGVDLADPQRQPPREKSATAPAAPPTQKPVTSSFAPQHVNNYPSGEAPRNAVHAPTMEP